MTITLLSEKIVKIRKERYCFACCRVFEAGSQMNKANFVDGSQIYSVYTCPTCHELTSDHLFSLYPNFDSAYDDGFSGGYIDECLNQFEFPCSTPAELLQSLNDNKHKSK